ncbi:MAG TPA: LysR family transcriptional regulator [Anaerolineae bacterium]|nr:LysR family transcriptional regulator [Anaerolineae bacterium]HOQ98037.1 LysR family transcriptional regulator [Anaerolineae bacterium]HPL29087.1 LysR family transcriptional regulator [Anaerolineae bacterium]
MDIDRLREFIVLAQTRSFAKAASALFCSQSTLSKRIKSTERELGVRLFDRTSRRVEITKFGELLLPYARQIVALQDEYAAVLQANQATDRDVLTLGSIRALAQYHITAVLGDFRRSRPQSTIRVVRATSEELRAMLRQRKVELAFVRTTTETDDDLTKVPYASDGLVVVLPTTHRLARQKVIALEQLANERFLLSDKHKPLYRLCMDACRQSGFEPKVADTDDKFENLIDMVTKGMGVAIMMKQLALYVANPRVVIVDTSPTVRSHIDLCYLKGAELSEAAKQFVACTRLHVAVTRARSAS